MGSPSPQRQAFPRFLSWRPSRASYARYCMPSMDVRGDRAIPTRANFTPYVLKPGRESFLTTNKVIGILGTEVDCRYSSAPLFVFRSLWRYQSSVLSMVSAGEPAKSSARLYSIALQWIAVRVPRALISRIDISPSEDRFC